MVLQSLAAPGAGIPLFAHLRTMERLDYYEILGVERTADESVIKRAYRTLAMRFHPDRNPGDSDCIARMKQINEAYAVLCDGNKRRLYDTYGHDGLSGYSESDIFSSVDFSSVFGGFGFGDGMFANLFGRGRTTTRERRRAPDLRYTIELTSGAGSNRRREGP